MPAVTGRYVRVTVGGVIYQIYREALEAGQDVVCMHTAGADTTRLVSAGSSRACAGVTIGRQDRDELCDEYFSGESTGPMLNILIAEGTPAVWQAERAGFGLPSNFSLFAAAVQLHHPDVRCTPLNIADGEALPFGTTLSDFDGVMFPGSPLHIYDPDPCVTRQIDFARAAFAAGVPVWGSCWGLQLAVVALGGSVRRNPRGRELPIARAITVTDSRPGPPASRLPSRRFRRALLAPRRDRNVAAELAGPGGERGLRRSGDRRTNLRSRGSFHGTQYHPEHTLAVSAALVEMRAAELVEEGFGTEPSEIVAIAADYRALDAEPTRRDLIWRYGIASEIMDPVRRTTEIGNWLRTVVVPRRV